MQKEFEKLMAEVDPSFAENMRVSAVISETMSNALNEAVDQYALPRDLAMKAALRAVQDDAVKKVMRSAVLTQASILERERPNFNDCAYIVYVKDEAGKVITWGGTTIINGELVNSAIDATLAIVCKDYPNDNVCFAYLTHADRSIAQHEHTFYEDKDSGYIGKEITNHVYDDFSKNPAISLADMVATMHTVIGL